jgi:hypothetical protein
MVQQRHYDAVVLSSCRAVDGSPRAHQPTGAARLSTAQAAERNVLLGRAELELCPGSQRTTALLAVPDVKEDVA